MTRPTAPTTAAPLSRRRFLTISACASLLAGQAGQAAPPADWQGVALGAEARITLHGPAHQTGPALDAALTRLRQIEALFNLHDPGSAVSRLNAAGFLPDLAPDFIRLLRLSDHVHHLTGGLFDPTVQPLWLALARGEDSRPARKAIGWNRLQTKSRGVKLAPGQALTLNGIAQGYAADALRETLARLGLTGALVDLGEFAALGGPWRVGIADPALGLVLDRPLRGNAIATSSPAAMALGSGGHILNPQGEAPPQWSTISVEADSAGLADGLSTALCFCNHAQLADILHRAGPSVTRITAIAANGDISTVET
ncbi:FAD:protein FMN transferase [Paracoccus sp. M683]|uniref:FAD:protein FMN transferase n=1 Tax=Paracoccus sp. M683 TaxID=2594268 RepID=UPI00117C3043|nr:FAD:protein FMN transferase [Paracoccus sp. M683]TRW99669.1 FAD:protein FMN transferase [Paracoccus sp. M683]